MFDYVRFACYCPMCGTEVSNFQSKDGPCLLATLEWSQVQNFYAICDNCDTWIEFKQVPPAPMPTHQMFVDENDPVDVCIPPNEIVYRVDNKETPGIYEYQKAKGIVE